MKFIWNFLNNCLTFENQAPPEMDPEELKIVEKLRLGDNSAYKFIYDRHYVPLCRFAFGFLHDDHLAETIVSDTIFHIYEIRGRLNITSSLRGYLVSAVRNRCLNLLDLDYSKKTTRFSAIPDGENWGFMIADKSNYPLGTLLEKECEGEIRQAVESLPLETRRVFELSRFESMSYKEIAHTVGISVNTVKYHIKNALVHLTKNLEKYLLAFLLIFILLL